MTRAADSHGGVAAEVLPPDPWQVWNAAVEWKEMGVATFFQVVARPTGEGEPVTIAASPPLVWPPANPANVQALADAVQELTAALVETGWTLSGGGDQWYAKRFVWEPAGVPQTEHSWRAEEPFVFTPEPEWPESTVDAWCCEIAWDAGFVESRFRAVARAPQTRRRGRTLATSRTLRWVLMAEPDHGAREHRDALAELARSLVAAGWEPVGRGAAWYGRRFCWLRPDAPPDALEPEPASVGKTPADAY